MEEANLKILACNMRRALRAPEECDIAYLLEAAARELDQLRAIALGQKALRRIGEAEIERLRADEELHRRAIDAGASYVKELEAEVERLKPPEPTCETRLCPCCGR